MKESNHHSTRLHPVFLTVLRTEWKICVVKSRFFRTVTRFEIRLEIVIINGHEPTIFRPCHLFSVHCFDLNPIILYVIFITYNPKNVISQKIRIISSIFFTGLWRKNSVRLYKKSDTQRILAADGIFWKPMQVVCSPHICFDWNTLERFSIN